VLSDFARCCPGDPSFRFGEGRRKFCLSYQARSLGLSSRLPSETDSLGRKK